ncbi:MAG: hypothetical protein U1F34_04620 [Gammaproteobacteria bacterium]
MLTEISFLTDPSEENRLRDPVYITVLAALSRWESWTACGRGNW